MGNDCYNFENEDEPRLTELLKNEVDGFLSSSADSDFIFDSSEEAKPLRYRPHAIVFRRQLTAQAVRDWKTCVISFLCLFSVAALISYGFILVLNPNRSRDVAFSRMNNAKKMCDEDDLAAVSVQNASELNVSNFYDVETLESIYRKYLNEETEVVLDIVDFWGVGQELGDFALFSHEPIQSDKSAINDVLDDTVRFKNTFSAQEIVLSALSVGALVFTIEKYYNDESSIQGIGLID